jgi:hypothetical protein
MWLPWGIRGSHTVHAPPTWHTMLPYGSDGSGNVHMALIWPPYGSYGSQMTPPTSPTWHHMAATIWHYMAPISHPPPVWCKWLPYGPHTVPTGPMWCHPSPYGSHMVPAAPIRCTALTWRHPPPIRHHMACIWHAWCT